MPVSDLLLAGGKLMVLGMGIVFGFLIFLVFAMRAMSAMAKALDRRGSEPAAVSAAPQPLVSAVPQDTLVAVISAAVARFRASRNQ